MVKPISDFSNPNCTFPLTASKTLNFDWFVTFSLLDDSIISIAMVSLVEL